MPDTEMTSVDETDEAILVQREDSGAGGGERQIQIHPLVIVNITDHQTRQKCNSQLSQTEAPQVIGALFGIQKGLDVAVCDSFEMKYDVGSGEMQIDKEFLTSRIQQFSQVFPGFELLGWYTVGAQALPSDLAVHRVVMEFNESPLFMILDPEAKGPSTKKKLPISLFESELHMLNGVPKMIFVKAPFKIETSETEGIAIDHISKITPIGDASKSSLHPYLGNVRDAVKMLDRQIDVLLCFLQAMKSGEAPMDHNLLRHISSICNQLPAMQSEHFDAAFTLEFNDALLVSYLATLTKGTTNVNTVVDRFAATQERHHHQRGTLLRSFVQHLRTKWLFVCYLYYTLIGGKATHFTAKTPSTSFRQRKMPIDINRLRPERGGDPDGVRADQQKRFLNVDIVNKVVELDEQWRKKQSEVETISMKMNALQQEIKALSKAKQDFKALSDERKDLSAQLPEKKKEAEALKELVDRELPKIGNTVDPTVPLSNNEDDNVVVKKWGVPIERDGLHYHHEVLHRIDGYEPERGVQVAGHRAYFLTGYGFLLEQALMAYATAFLMKAQYKMLKPPFFMNKECMAAVAQLDDFDEQLYKVIGEDEKYLIATSEQPICGYHKGEWITESSLPLRYGGFSTCFRKEAGSHGKDTWGIFRVHQFDKIEQFCITDPESSTAMHEELLQHAEEFYQSLELPYRVVNIVSGELNNAAVKKYDLEAWFPAYKEYRELVSASNCTDFQSRAMEIRCGVKKENQREKKYVHMLNSTLCASTRTVCCILENFQDDNGVKVPEVLVPFMGGVTYLPFTREVKVNVQAAKMQKAAKKKGAKQ